MKPDYVLTSEEPAIMPTLIEQFGVSFDDVVVTVGNKIHTKYALTADLLEHELVHVKQQTAYEGGSDAWWQRYLVDEKFRLSQEIEAYRVQYNFLRGTMKDRNKLAVQAHRIAATLSGPMYGNCISFAAAKLQVTA